MTTIESNPPRNSSPPPAAVKWRRQARQRRIARRVNCPIKTTTKRTDPHGLRLAPQHAAKPGVIVDADLILLNYGAVISRHGVRAFGAGVFRPPLETR